MIWTVFIYKLNKKLLIQRQLFALMILFFSKCNRFKIGTQKFLEFRNILPIQTGKHVCDVADICGLFQTGYSQRRAPAHGRVFQARQRKIPGHRAQYLREKNWIFQKVQPAVPGYSQELPAGGGYAGQFPLRCVQSCVHPVSYTISTV